MNKLLWISPYSLHDHASDCARQALRMVKTLAQYQYEVCVLSPTIYSSRDPLALDAVAAKSLLESEESFQLVDEGVNFIYIRTISQHFNDMTAIEQRALLNEFTPMVVDFKPDLVVVNSCDVVTLCCLNQAKNNGLYTAFVLQETIPDFFHFADVDLILSTSHSLTKRFVTPLGREAAYIGPFIPLEGPLAPPAATIKRTVLTPASLRFGAKTAAAAHAAIHHQDLSALEQGTANFNRATRRKHKLSKDTKATATPQVDLSVLNANAPEMNAGWQPTSIPTIEDLKGHNKLAQALTSLHHTSHFGLTHQPHITESLTESQTIEPQRPQQKLVDPSKRHTILLVEPSLEHGLGIFLELYLKHKRQPQKELQQAEFVILETQSQQFAQSVEQYYETTGLKAYDLSDFAGIRVLPPLAEPDEQLQSVLKDTRVLLLPTLCAASTSTVGLQALSYGVEVITTEQPELCELLGPHCTYIDVQQEVVNHLSLVTPEEEVQKWHEALVAVFTKPARTAELKDFLQQYQYSVGQYRLILSLMPLLEQNRSSEPHLMQNCSYSLRLVRKQQALEAAMRAAAASLAEPLPDSPDELYSEEEDDEDSLSNSFD